MTEIQISKSALIHNLRAYRRAIGGGKIMAVVKSEAYGHGLNLVARSIEKETDWFGVVSGAEAIQLRQQGIRKPVLVMSFYSLKEIPELLKRKIALVVYDLQQARIISNFAKKQQLIANIHLKIDTGTARLGISPKNVPAFVDLLLKLSNIKIEGVFSHFAASEENLVFTELQNHLFDSAVTELERRGLSPMRHIACTAAGLLLPASRHDIVRLGLGLYGLWPPPQTRRGTKFSLKPVLSWSTDVIQVKLLPKGASVGYGLTYRTTRPTKLAVLPVGYFDGFDRKLSNQGEVLIKGRRCKILGRVCMNLMMVDATRVKNVKVGDRVVLIGKQGRDEITVEELAEKIGTINYEVVARINPLIPRRLI